MADETKQITDEELDRAANEQLEDEEVGEVAEKTADELDKVEEELEQVEEKLENTEDNAEKTRLGRKVKQLQDSFGELTSKLDQLIALQQPKKAIEQEQDEIDFQIPLTKADLEAMLPELLKKRQEAELAGKQTYEKTYINEVVNVLGKELKDEQHDEVSKIMLEKYNVVVTGDPRTDAQINWLKAERDWYALGKGKRSIKVKEEKPAPHVDDENKETVNDSEVMSKLDPQAREYAERMGLKPDMIKKALKFK